MDRSDIHKINKENLQYVRLKKICDQNVLIWLENSIDELDPIYFNHLIYQIIENEKNKNRKINEKQLKLPKFKASEFKNTNSPIFNMLQSNIFSKVQSESTQIKSKIMEKMEEKMDKNEKFWKILSFKFDPLFCFERFLENDFDVDYQITENIHHSLKITKYQEGTDLLGEYYNRKGLKIIFIKNINQEITRKSYFFHKLMKINYLLHHLVRIFNKEFKQDKIYFGKGCILRRNDEIFYAEKPLKKEVKENTLFFDYFCHWIYHNSKQKLVFEIKKNNILSNFVPHSYNRYFEEFGDEGFEKIEFLMRNHKCNICNKLDSYQKKIVKKCTNIFCNEFSFEEYCKNCSLEILTKELKKCERCYKFFYILPNEFIFKGKNLPKFCANCN